VLLLDSEHTAQSVSSYSGALLGDGLLICDALISRTLVPGRHGVSTAGMKTPAVLEITSSQFVRLQIMTKGTIRAPCIAKSGTTLLAVRLVPYPGKEGA
jgi:hypothetical protein